MGGVCCNESNLESKTDNTGQSDGINRTKKNDSESKKVPQTILDTPLSHDDDDSGRPVDETSQLAQNTPIPCFFVFLKIFTRDIFYKQMLVELLATETSIIERHL